MISSLSRRSTETLEELFGTSAWSAQLRAHRDTATQAEATPDVCAKLDSILITASATCAKADVDDVF